MIRSPLDRRRIVKPDIARILKKGSFLNLQTPDLCFAIGDYRKGTYNLAQGFEELRVAINDHKQNLLNKKQVWSLKGRPLFADRELSPGILLALVLRKYVYQVFLCGTDRIFISDDQTFSAFFKYRILDEKMTIDYYNINNSETVAHGITLGSAIVGVVYKNVTDTYDTKSKLLSQFELACKTDGPDPFKNVLPRQTSEPSRGLSMRLVDFRRVCLVMSLQKIWT